MSQSGKRKRAKGWGKRKGFSGAYAENDVSDGEDTEDLQAAIAVAYAGIEDAKDHDKTSFPPETEAQQAQRIKPFLQEDETYHFPGAITWMWNDVEWVLTYHTAQMTGIKGMLPQLMRRQCTMKEKTTMIELGIMKRNLLSMNCAAYIWKDTEEVLKSSFTAIYDEVQRSNLLNRRVFIGSGPEAYDGIYLGDKDAANVSADGLPPIFDRVKKPKHLASQGDPLDEASKFAASIQAVRDFNKDLLRERKSFRQVFYDPHTRLVQIPKMLAIELTETLTEEEKLYPAAALPNQFVANYTEYTPEQMSMLPVDTITKWHVTPAELFPNEGEDSGDEDTGRQSDEDATEADAA